MIALLQRLANSTGALRTSTAAIPKSAVKKDGLARTTKGVVYIIASGATKVPATRVKTQGLALTPKGAIYTTNSAPASTAVMNGGLAIRADGALHVTSTQGNINNEGFSVTNGRLYIV